MISFSESKRTYSKNDCGVYRPDPLNYHPIRKPLRFDPSPVAGNIPFYADIAKNPACEDTVACREFWEEQFEYCINGYTTSGMFIPGRYYHYLNFETITGLLGPQYPWFIDIDYEYYLAIEWIKKNRWLGIIEPKARRKGATERAVNILNHGARFIDGYKGGIAAGLLPYVDQFKGKFDLSNRECRPEFKLTELKNNNKQIEFGYKVRNILGNIEDSGSMSSILMATMYDDPKKFEGNYFHDVICEESGEFPLLPSVVQSIKPALMMGSEVLGTIHIQGTGGNILSSSKGFKEIYDDSEKLKFLRFEITGQRLLYPHIGLSSTLKDRHVKKKIGALVQDMPSFAGWKDYEMVGCEDVWKADQWIITEDENLQQLGNKKQLREHRQNYPRDVEDIFTSAGKNNFDSDILYGSLNQSMQEDETYEKIVLDFEKVKDRFGVWVIRQPLNVVARPYKESDPLWKMVLIMKGQKPSPIANMDVGGTDAYEADESNTSKSKMGVIVFRDFRFSTGICPVLEKSAILPICAYYDRPPKRELAFEMSLKISVYWNLKRNMMLSAEHESCIEFYKKNGGVQYLSHRPKSMDSAKGEQIHKFGVKMTGYSKPRVLALQQDYVSNWGHLLRLDWLIRDYLAYDEENIGTDWDLADSAGNAIVRIHDRHTNVPDELPEENEDVGNSDEITYYYDQNGNFKANIPKVRKKNKSKNEIVEPVEDYVTSY